MRNFVTRYLSFDSRQSFQGLNHPGNKNIFTLKNSEITLSLRIVLDTSMKDQYIFCDVYKSRPYLGTERHMKNIFATQHRQSRHVF